MEKTTYSWISKYEFRMNATNQIFHVKDVIGYDVNVDELKFFIFFNNKFYIQVNSPNYEKFKHDFKKFLNIYCDYNDCYAMLFT